MVPVERKSKVRVLPIKIFFVAGRLLRACILEN